MRDMDTDMLGIYGPIYKHPSVLATAHLSSVNVKHETKHFVRLACKIVCSSFCGHLFNCSRQSAVDSRQLDS